MDLLLPISGGGLTHSVISRPHLCILGKRGRSSGVHSMENYA